MQLGLKNRLRLISLFPILILFSIATYFVYDSYKNYQAVGSFQEKLTADRVLSTIDKEAIQAKREALKFLGFTLTLLIVSIILAILGFLLAHEIAKNIKNLEEILRRVAIDANILEGNNIKPSDINLNTAKGTLKAYELIEDTINQTRKDKDTAQEASKAKSIFLANMSHEIRTPLNGVLGFTELLKESGLREEQHEFVEIIEKSSQNLLEIINYILDLSKIESNKLEMENIAFNPIEEFESAVEVCAVRASEKNIHLGCFIDPRLEHNLKGDPAKIKEVVINLLSNAIKFTDNFGSINVDIRKLDSTQSGICKVRFEIQDNGIGIASEQKSKIFDAFTQADTSITRKYGGTGLGLTISKKILELIGSELNLHSELTKGTTFYFTIDFEELYATKESLQGSFKNIYAFILKPSHHEKKQEKYFLQYLDFFGVRYSFFKNIHELENLQKKAHANLLFVDYDYTKEESLSVYDQLGEKLIVLTKASFIKKIDSLHLNIFKTLYEPLNSSKIKQLLQNAQMQSLKTAKVQNQNKQKILTQTTKFHAEILVAEDNLINQKLIQRTLEDLGVNVTFASNGLEAFQKRKDGNFDLIFMDIQMPLLDGIEATKEILKYEADYQKVHVPIIALTANALKGDRERFLSAGLDEYITKPLIRKEIILLLNYFLFEHKLYLKEQKDTNL